MNCRWLAVALVLCACAAVGWGQRRPIPRLPSRSQICRLMQDRSFVRRQVRCALGQQGACERIPQLQRRTATFLRNAIPAALGVGECDFCTRDDLQKVRLVMAEMNTRYPEESQMLLSAYDNEINQFANGQEVLQARLQLREGC
ncbi:unnamed protein product [Darwinula stevensoni]|uniref:Uncharacterized protein n=1 Tax=Darwinula stevensoni TaxID=69355 RepID=A0A7R9AB68_9CRUS|nr:unnamed protein product [Darwinula stevensoni]CAG0898919.1 unnamed protein product [Darwinula stevensoni]